MLETVLDGYNATIMAYGQTGSGKTYTMGISNDTTTNTNDMSGLIPRFMNDLFRRLTIKKSKKSESNSDSFEYEITTSFLEVYGDDVYDLLNSSTQKQHTGKEKDLPTSLRLREERDGKVICVGLTDRICMNALETLAVLQEGSLNRTTASTAMNNTSSRSHAIFTVTIRQNDVVKLQNNHPDANDVIDNNICTESCNMEKSTLVSNTTVSQFTFVDLAGSERLLKTGCVGQQAKEGIQINQGLLALGNVIHALAAKEDEDNNISRGSKTPPKRMANRTKSFSPMRNNMSRGNARNRSISPTRNQSNTTPNTTLRKRNNKYIPYRDSRLTRLLQDALGGNSQTYFLACVSSDIENLNETLSTLQYANRARNIRNAPKKISSTNASGDEKLQQEIEELRALVTTLKTELQNRSQLCKSEDTGTKDVVSSSDDAISSLCDPGEVSSSDPACVEKSYFTETTCLKDSQGMSQCSLEALREQPLSASSSSLHSQSEHTSVIDNSLIFSIKISEEMTAHQNELEELRQSLLGYEDIKAHYRQLVDDVRKLEQEKHQLTVELDTLSDDNSNAASTSAVVNKKIESINCSLQLARAETTKQRLACRKAEQDANRCRLLESKLLEMNKCLTALSQQRKDESRRHQQNLNENNREISLLKRKEFSFEKGMSKLKADVEMYRRNLGRRQEECMKLTQQLKERETKTTGMLLLNQDEHNRIRNRINNNEVGRKEVVVDKDESTLDNITESKSDTLMLNVDSNEIAPISPEIELVYDLLEKCIREKVKFAQLADEFEQAECEYNDASEALDSTILDLSRMIKKSEAQSAVSNQVSNPTGTDDFVEPDETQKVLVKTDGSDRLVNELEEKIREYVDEMTAYENELERMELKLNRYEERDAYENTAMRNLIKNKSAPIVRSLFLGLVDRLAEAEVRSLV